MTDAPDTLLTVAGKINAFFDKAAQADKKAEDYRISAGQLLIEARQRVEAEEKIGWNKWCEANIKRSRQDINKVMRIAGAPDPAKAAQEAREANRADNAAYRARHVAHVSDKGGRSASTSKPPAEKAGEALAAHATRIVDTVDALEMLDGVMAHGVSTAKLPVPEVAAEVSKRGLGDKLDAMIALLQEIRDAAFARAAA